MKGAWQISDGGTDEGRTEAQIDQSNLKGPTGTNESAWCMKPAGLRRQPITGRALNEITNHAPRLASSFPISDKAPHTFGPSFTPQQAASCSVCVCVLTYVCARVCVCVHACTSGSDCILIPLLRYPFILELVDQLCRFVAATHQNTAGAPKESIFYTKLLKQLKCPFRRKL